MTTCRNYSPNSKEVQNFNYLYYIYREQNAFIKHSYQLQQYNFKFYEIFITQPF